MNFQSSKEIQLVLIRLTRSINQMEFKKSEFQVLHLLLFQLNLMIKNKLIINS